MRIVEQALRFDSPIRCIETGHPIPAPRWWIWPNGKHQGIRRRCRRHRFHARGSPAAAPHITSRLGIVLPAKEDTTAIEGLMRHFKLVMFGHGIRPPKGEVYFPVEGANGELGFYVVSDGSSMAYRVRVRPPCFAIMSALPKLLVGDMVADLTPTFGSVNMIGGELDR